MYERILVALDGSDVAEEVVPYADALAEKFDSTLLLVQVTPRLSSASVAASPPMDPRLVQRMEQQATDHYLTVVAERLRAKGRTVITAQPEGNAAEELLEHARVTGVDLIAMTTHGRSGLGRLVFGSVADEVLQKASCPVLLVRIGIG